MIRLTSGICRMPARSISSVNTVDARFASEFAEPVCASFSWSRSNSMAAATNSGEGSVTITPHGMVRGFLSCAFLSCAPDHWKIARIQRIAVPEGMRAVGCGGVQGRSWNRMSSPV